MPANLEGRRAVVTGASSGIGRAIALELARQGADVAVHYARSEQRARGVVEEITALGRNAISVQADLADVDHAEFVSRCWNEVGPVDIWVNNAGVDLLTGDGPNYSFEEKLRLLLAIDVTGTVLLSRLVGQRMKRQCELDEANAPTTPCILNIGWDQADRGMEGDSAELFSTAKNAVMGFTRSLAVSLAPHVRVNCIAPGWIRTAWGDDAPDAWQERVLRETPLKRWGLPEDIAKLAAFLVSPNAEYLTGQVINANGGAIR